LKIARLHIQNLRSIEDLEIDLVAPDGMPRRRLVLLGGNGCGKTTTLLAIAHLLGQVNSDFGAERMGAGDVRQLGRAQSSPSHAVMQPTGIIELQVSLSRDERARLAQIMPRQKPPEHATLQASFGGPPRDAEQQHVLVPPGMDTRAVARFFGHGDPLIQLLMDRDAGRLDPVNEALARAASLYGPHPLGVLLPADRGTLQESSSISVASLSTFEPRAGCLSTERARFQVIPALLALARLSPERNERSDMVSRMWKVLEKYFPEMPRPVAVRGLELHFAASEGAIVDFSRLSDGQRAVLLILGELALRNPVGGVVLIDELEQHLHPRWQRAILDALVALLPDSQFIITTQAPYLAAAAPDDVVKVGDWTRDGPQE
jgi:ABC-type cobalamin/Fe3+-siderophores transport system ATPase subunit